MDPTETLTRIRQTLVEVFDGDDVEALRTLQDLADLIEALDQWIMAGGFLPVPWTMAQLRGLA